MSAQRITFVLDLFNKADAKTRARSDKALNILLEALTQIDELYLADFPDTPLLYQSGVEYQEEPPGAEDWQDIPVSRALRWADCLPVDTLVLRGDYSLCALSELEAGDVIMGDGALTRVLDVMLTGDKPILAFDLDNGCTLRCSPDHRLFLRNGEEIRAENVKVGDALKSLGEIPCAAEDWRPDERFSATDLAWLVGVYIADGWHDKRGNRFAISGDDEKPKRGKVEQKDRIQSMMHDAGITTTRPRKWVDVYNAPLTRIMMRSGARALDKRVHEMRLSRGQVETLLEGLRTDSSVSQGGTVTHETISPTLALQIRILYRMLGQSVHIRRWDEHGGLGSHPIYRITVRKHPEDSERPTAAQTKTESTKVRAIRSEEPVPCADIETESGSFYLPESDLIVHNCEDLAAWRCAEFRKRGIHARPVFTREQQSDGTVLFHILVELPDGTIEDPSRQLGMR